MSPAARIALLWLGFAATHMGLSSLRVRAWLVARLGERPFQGQTPKDAYFVKCDKETTTQSDINRGVVNILVGFAPLKPAEFVVLKIQQIAGQIET